MCIKCIKSGVNYKMKMNKIEEYNEFVRSKLDAFPTAYAFSEKQLEEAIEKLGAKSRDDLISVGFGGLIRRTDIDKWNQMWHEISEERKRLMKDDDFAYQMFFNTMSNHEYIFTLDDDEIIDACGLTPAIVYGDDKLKDVYNQAKRDYISSFNY